ncbi:MAG: periplasmic heavy metal sensor [bacterium]
MKKSWQIVSIVLLVWLAVSSSQASAAWWGRDKAKGKNRGGQIVKRLNLTEAQKTQFLAAQEKIRKEVAPLLEKIKGEGEKLKAELIKDTPDRPAIVKSLLVIKSAQGDIEIKRLDSLLDLKASLTPEQKQKFNDLMKKPRLFSFGKK